MISTAKAKITHRHTPTVSEVVATQHEDTSPATHPPLVSPQHHSREPASLTCLPILDLSGNPLFWQAFWDSFETAVHNNTTLTGVQKLSY